MNAVAEPIVRLGGTVDVEDVGIREHALVVVRRAIEHQHLIALRDRDTVQLHVACGGARKPLHRRDIAHELVDRARPLRWIGRELRALFWMTTELEHTVREHVHRGVLRRIVQERTEPADLRVGQRLALDLGVDDL